MISVRRNGGRNALLVGYVRVARNVTATRRIIISAYAVYTGTTFSPRAFVLARIGRYFLINISIIMAK